MNAKLFKDLEALDFSETWKVKRVLQNIANDINYLKEVGSKRQLSHMIAAIEYFISINRPRYSQSLSSLPLEEKRFIIELLGMRDVANNIVGKK